VAARFVPIPITCHQNHILPQICSKFTVFSCHTWRICCTLGAIALFGIGICFQNWCCRAHEWPHQGDIEPKAVADRLSKLEYVESNIIM
jgi:hypothetical protein